MYCITRIAELNQCEKMLHIRAFPVVRVYIRPNSATSGYKSHVVTLPHNFQHNVYVLPRTVASVPWFILNKQKVTMQTIRF